METQPVVIEKILNASIQKVWEALTVKEKMKEWYFDLATFKPEVGFEFQFYGGTDEKKYLHICRITQVIPQKILSYTWSYENVPVETLVTFELFEEAGNRTKIRLTHLGIENFPKENPDFAKNNFVEGWTYFINTSLKDYVEKTQSQLSGLSQ